MGRFSWEQFLHCVILALTCTMKGQVAGQEMLDIIQGLNSTKTDSLTGLRYTTGQDSNTSALLLEDTNRHISAPHPLAWRAMRYLLNQDEITFLFTLRQETGNSGTLLAFSAGSNSILEIESSGRKNEIRLYFIHMQKVRLETFPYRLDDGLWHKLAVTIVRDQVSIFVDCSRIYERTIQLPDLISPIQPLTLFIGQRNGQQALFRGALQDVKILTQASGYLLQCQNQHIDCPSCVKIKTLEEKVKEMSLMYNDLQVKLSKAEDLLSELKQCDCKKYCDDQDERGEGEEWHKYECSKCNCQNNSQQCHHVKCLPLNCSHPVYKDGECCPLCPTNCYYGGKFYDHGQTASPDACVTCTCDNGRMVCERQDKEVTCPKLGCPKSEWIEIHEQCCPVCKGTDFCSLGHSCHANASCVNLATKYACQCHAGFHGDGHSCEDVNECQVPGGPLGHHCNNKSVCVNTQGSYRCDCTRGHKRLGSYECTDKLSSGSETLQSTVLPVVILIILSLIPLH